ncbi:MAG TPA: MoxR family ATPase [Deltaproteobacteria bacterium]|nr:MoxR family ATPase [Deltaproteobacteria bacterium]
MNIHERIETIISHMQHVFLGQEHVVTSILCAFFARGHVLLEGVPGVGKTLIALALAKLLNLSFKRIQFTNDLLPSDVTGFHTFRSPVDSMDLIKGPLFASIVLADEINRTSPKTQSALLEAMEESQVTIDGMTYVLPEPFMVIATQNPIEVTGTFPLPESQLDRFLIKTIVGYPPVEKEAEILRKDIDHSDALGLEPVTDRHEILQLLARVNTIIVHPDILGYIGAIVRTSRAHREIELGISPRGGLALKRASQAYAFIHGRAFVTPGDVQSVCPWVLAHRIIVKQGNAERVIEEILNEVELPL